MDVAALATRLELPDQHGADREDDDRHAERQQETRAKPLVALLEVEQSPELLADHVVLLAEASPRAAAVARHVVQHRGWRTWRRHAQHLHRLGDTSDVREHP